MRRRPGTLLLVAALVSWAGCGHGGLGASSAEADPAWMFVRQVPFVQQENQTDCGAAALAMALGHGGRPTRVEDITSVVAPEKGKGIYATELRDFARRLGFEAYLISGTLEDLRTEIGRGHPMVVGLVKTQGRRRFSHYELVIGMRRDGTRIVTLDPASGPREQSTAEFMAEWSGSSQAALVVWRATPRTLGAEWPAPVTLGKLVDGSLEATTVSLASPPVSRRRPLIRSPVFQVTACVRAAPTTPASRTLLRVGESGR